MVDTFMNNLTPKSESMELQNATPQGTAPRRRISSPVAAASIFNTLREADSGDAALRRAVIQGMIDGNPPYRQRELEELGLGTMVNVNFMTMRANLDARASAGHELFAEVPTLVDVTPYATGSTSDVYKYCAILAEEFTTLVSRWSGFLSCMDLIWRDSDAYGLGCGVFPDEWDWRLRPVRRGSLLVLPKARIEVDENEVIMVRGELRAGEIFELLESPKAASERGWNLPALREVLVNVFVGGAQGNVSDAYQRSTWESVQQSARNNDATFQQKQFEQVRVVHIFVREVAAPRKVSHLIIPEDASTPVFLYEGYSRYSDMSEVVWWMPYNYGDGLVHSVRGIASYLVQHEDLSNRLLSRVFDAGFFSASPWIQPVAYGDLSRLQFMQHGMVTIVPPDVRMLPAAFQPQLGALLQLRGVSEQVMRNNTGTYRPHNEMLEREAMKTAREVIEESSREARFEKAAIAHRYTHLDRLYREIFRRIMRRELHSSRIDYPGSKEARAFFERCLARGVSRDFMLQWERNVRVVAYRALGLGSLGVRYDITSQLVSMRGSFDEAGRNAAVRDWVAARVGYRNADRYVAAVNRDALPTNETSIALLEWNDTVEGAEAVVGVDQLHKVHIEVFLTRVAEMAQSANIYGGTPSPEILRTLQLGVAHIQQHMQHLAEDETRAEYVKQVMEVLQEVAKVIVALEREVERDAMAQAQVQAQQEQVVADAEQVMRDRDFEARVMEMSQRLELERAKQQGLNEVRRERVQGQLEISRARTAEELRLKGERQAAEINLAAVESEARRQGA